MIHTVKGFGIVNKAEIDVFLELSCFFHDPADVGNLISGSSVFSKTSFNIWKFMVHVLLKPECGTFVTIDEQITIFFFFFSPAFLRYNWLIHCYELRSIGFVFQSPSCVRLFATPWTAAFQASLSFTISQSLIKFMSIESVIPSNHLILCHPLFLLPSVFSSIRVFSNKSALHIKWPNHWRFTFSTSLSNEWLGMISFKIDWFDLLLCKGLSRVFSSTTVWKHQLFGI